MTDCSDCKLCLDIIGCGIRCLFKQSTVISVDEENITIVIVAARRMRLVRIKELGPIDLLVNPENSVDQWG